MKTIWKHRRLSALAALAVLLGSISAAVAQITFAINADLSFGLIEYSTTHSGQVRIGTNGNVTLTGSGLMYVSGAFPANVRITAIPASGILDIKCRANGSLRGNSTGSALTMNRLQISIDTGVNYDAANLCAGIAGGNPVAVSVDLAVSPTPIVLIGGRLVVGAGALNNTNTSYSSANAGGQHIRLRVVYQ